MAATYNREGLREEIRAALLVAPRTRGQLDGDAGTECRREFASKPTRTIQIDDETRLEVEVEAIRTLACKTFKRSSLPLEHDAFLKTKLVRSVKSAPSGKGDWLVYCYSEGAQMPSREFLLEVIAQFMHEEPKVMRSASKKLVNSLAFLAAQQVRDELNAKKEFLPQTRIAQLAGKSETAWKKDWSARWKRLLRIIGEMDIEGLDYVYIDEFLRVASSRRNAAVPVQSCVPFALRHLIPARMAI